MILKLKKMKLRSLATITGGQTDAVTNSHGHITKSAGNFDADNKTSDTDTETKLCLNIEDKI